MDMAKSLFLELTLTLLCIHCCQESFGLACQRSCTSILQDSLKCRVFCGAKIQKADRFPRGIRSTNSPSSVKTELSTELPKKKHDFLDCDHVYPKVFDKYYGVSNPHVTNLTIQYSRWQNKTIARVEWGVCKECLEKYAFCHGYFVQWKFPYEKWRCYQIKDLNKKYFILNDTGGFDGIKRFGISVISYPSAKTGIEIIYMDPPPPENITTLPSTVVQNPTTIQDYHLPTQYPSKPDIPRETQNAKKNVQGEPKTLKVVLGLFFAFVLCIFSLLMYWFYKRHKKMNYNIPIHHPSYKKVINGAHYISYLPGSSNTWHVLSMYSWLTSHHIDVIMDKMHDPKIYNSLGPKRFGEKFVAKAEKVIMIISPGYLELCWLDDAVELNSKTALNSLDKERLYSEMTYIKNELSTTINIAESRFIPVLIDVQENDLPKWLSKITTVHWPKDGKSDRFLAILKGDSPE